MWNWSDQTGIKAEAYDLNKSGANVWISNTFQTMCTAGSSGQQQSGLVNRSLKQWPYIWTFFVKKYNHNQLQTKDITLILILGMGITRRKPVALTRNMVTLWRRRTSAPTHPPPTPRPRPSLVFKLEKIPDCPARCSLFKYQPLVRYPVTGRLWWERATNSLSYVDCHFEWWSWD